MRSSGAYAAALICKHSVKPLPVIAAQAAIQTARFRPARFSGQYSAYTGVWTPAFAGVTKKWVYRMFVLILALEIAGCSSKSENSAKSPDSPVTYHSQIGFSCPIPGNWKVSENQPGSLAAFYGPPNGKAPYSSSIAVYRYPKGHSDFSSPKEYYLRNAGKNASSLIQKKIASGAAYYFSDKEASPGIARPKQTTREEYYLIAFQGGFYALVYLGPEKNASPGEAVFQKLAQGFKTKDSEK